MSVRPIKSYWFFFIFDKSFLCDFFEYWFIHSKSKYNILSEVRKYKFVLQFPVFNSFATDLRTILLHIYIFFIQFWHYKSKCSFVLPLQSFAFMYVVILAYEKNLLLLKIYRGGEGNYIQPISRPVNRPATPRNPQISIKSFILHDLLKKIA